MQVYEISVFLGIWEIFVSASCDVFFARFDVGWKWFPWFKTIHVGDSKSCGRGKDRLTVPSFFRGVQLANFNVGGYYPFMFQPRKSRNLFGLWRRDGFLKSLSHLKRPGYMYIYIYNEIPPKKETGWHKPSFLHYLVVSFPRLWKMCDHQNGLWENPFPNPFPNPTVMTWSPSNCEICHLWANPSRGSTI